MHGLVEWLVLLCTITDDDSTSGGVNSADGRVVAGIVIGIIAGLMQT